MDIKMNQKLIDCCIENKPIFDKYLKERGGFQVGDWVYSKEYGIGLISEISKLNGWRCRICYETNNATYWLDETLNLIWTPSTDDLIEIKKIQNEHTDEFGWQWILASAFVPAKIWIKSTSLRAALAYWAVKSDKEIK